MRNCTTCPKYKSCTELCSLAEEYAEQDNVVGQEYYIDPKIIEETVHEDWQQMMCSNVPMTKREKVVVRLSALGLNNEDICQVLNITSGNLYVILSRLRKKAREM